jgi:NAD(P)-dependent dehydrogenase (short-subunit alcohol dehydrogenase family)
MRFSGKAAVVTGGASGIGKGIVERLSSEGAAVLIADAAGDRAGEVAEALSAQGRDVRHIQADVSAADQVSAMFQSAKAAFGGVDIIVNNAGISSVEGPITDIAEDLFDRYLAVNLKGVFLGVKHGLPHLIERGGGAIVNIASIGAYRGIPGTLSYTAAKAGVIHITRIVAVEYGPKGVRANSISPGGILTPLSMRINQQSEDDLRRTLVNNQPVRRAGVPADIAAATAFLASDDAAFVSGIDLPVDGGWNAMYSQVPSQLQSQWS